MSTPEVKAIEESIKHWEEDILKPLLNGENIVKKEIEERHCVASRPYWEGTDTAVSCYSKDCAMCEFVKDCGDCAYFLVYGEECCGAGEAWSLFIDNPGVETAQGMINALKYLLINP